MVSHRSVNDLFSRVWMLNFVPFALLDLFLELGFLVSSLIDVFCPNLTVGVEIYCWTCCFASKF